MPVGVQGTGSALRMKAASFHEALERCVPLRRELHRYAYRGDIRILDRMGLEAAACPCYRIVKALAG